MKLFLFAVAILCLVWLILATINGNERTLRELETEETARPS